MKKLTSFTLISLIGITSIATINFVNPAPVLAQWGRNHYASINGGKVYTVNRSKHGLIMETSLGIFYIGKSGGVIQQINKRRYPGSWQKKYYGEDGLKLYVYTQNKTYTFDLYAEYGEHF